jgi:hypothetical protein
MNPMMFPLQKIAAPMGEMAALCLLTILHQMKSHVLMGERFAFGG